MHKLGHLLPTQTDNCALYFAGPYHFRELDCRSDFPERLGLAAMIAVLAFTEVFDDSVFGAAVFITWATGTAQNQAAPLPVSQVGTTNTTVGAANFPVSYGTSASMLTPSQPGYISSYKQIYTGFTNATTGAYNSNPTLNYTSQAFHHVELTNLKPATQYFYQVFVTASQVHLFDATRMNGRG